jgi:hypothetical protein
MSTAPSTMGADVPAGTEVRGWDLQVTVPAAQPPGAYSSTLAISVVAAP